MTVEVSESGRKAQCIVPAESDSLPMFSFCLLVIAIGVGGFGWIGGVWNAIPFAIIKRKVGDRTTEPLSFSLDLPFVH